MLPTLAMCQSPAVQTLAPSRGMHLRTRARTSPGEGARPQPARTYSLPA
jgi:hypothetical protein